MSLIKSRLSKLEKIIAEKNREINIYLVFANDDTMMIKGLNFLGSIEEGEKLINEMDKPGTIFVRQNTPRSYDVFDCAI